MSKKSGDSIKFSKLLIKMDRWAKYNKSVVLVALAFMFFLGSFLSAFLFRSFFTQSAVTWYNTEWNYRKQITIDDTRVAGSSTLSNFVVLVNLSSDAQLAANAKANADDILFTSADGTTKLAHEIEYYNTSSGSLVAWVQVPSLSATVDTVLFMYYGNSGATDQQNVTGVWGTEYKAVYHLAEDPSGTAPQIIDSSQFGNSGTSVGSMLTTDQQVGKMDGSIRFDGSNDHLRVDDSASLDISGALTLSAWINSSDLSGVDTSGIISKYRGVLSGSPTTGERSYTLGLNEPQDRIRFQISADGDTNTINLSSPADSITTGSWYYVTGVFVPSTSAEIFINGVSVVSVTDGVPAAISVGDSPLWIGAHFNNQYTHNLYTGNIDEVRIQSTARNSNWLLTEFNNQDSPSTFYSLGVQETRTAPSAISDLGATAGVDSVSLTWTAPADNGFAITDYVVEYKQTSAGSYSTFNDGVGSSTGAVVTGLTPGTSYDFRVFAVSSAGNGSYSNVVSATPVSGSLSWYDEDWLYRKAITVNNSQVSGSSSHTNFPLLVRLGSDAQLAANALSNANDILFTSENGITKLNHEIELYNTSTGELYAWVRIPSLSTSEDTTIYMYYGNSAAANQQNASGVWGSEYRAVYHLKENPAGTAPQILDSTSNANNGTTVGAMVSGDQLSGIIDGSVRFDGSNDHVSIADANSLDVTGALTLSGWINASDLAGSDDAGIISKYRGVVSGNTVTGQRAYSLTVNEPGDRLKFSLSNDGTTSNVSIQTSSNTLTTGQWYYVAATYVPSTQVALYINGSLSTSTSSNIPASIASTISPVWIGTHYNNQYVHNMFTGQLDELRIASVARSAGWLQTEYNNQSNPSTFYTVGSAQSNGSPAEAVDDLNASGGNQQVTLTWSAPEDNGAAISDYVVEYKLTSSGVYSVFNDGVNGNTGATVTGLLAGEQYDFRVYAVNSAGSAPYSNVATATVNAGVPGAVNTLSPSPGDSQVVLNWSAPTDNGSSITDYVVEYKESSSGSYLTFSDGVSATTGATVTGLTNGTAYDFKVYAVNGVGSGPDSNVVSATPDSVAAVPGAITNLQAVSGNQQVTLVWSAPSDGGSAITDYVIEYKESSSPGDFATFSDGVSATTGALVTGLTNGTSYDFRVYAVNAEGNGPNSNTVSTAPAGTPAQISDLAGLGGPGQVNLTWTTPNNGGSSISDYVILYKRTADSVYTIFNDGQSTNPNATVTGLNNGVSYDFKVYAVNSNGNGSDSNIVTVTPSTVPGMISSVTVLPQVGQFSLSWNTPNTGGSTILDYVIQYKLSTSSTYTLFSDAVSPVTNAAVTGLSYGAAYDFKIYAVNANGNGPELVVSGHLAKPSTGGCRSDLNNDNNVNIADFAIFAQNWNRPLQNCSWDIVGNDCRFTLQDFAVFAQNWNRVDSCF